MGHATAVLADGDEVVAHLQEEIVDGYRQMVVFRLGMLTLPSCTMRIHLLVILRLIHELHRGLVDVEKGTHLTGAHALVAFLLLRVEGLVSLPADSVIGVLLARVLLPVVPVEGYAMFIGLHGLTTFLGLGEQRVLVGLVTVLVAVQGHRQGIEGRNGDTPRIETGCSLLLRVQPYAVVCFGTLQSIDD